MSGSPTEWLAAWVTGLEQFQTVAVVGMALILGVSFLRLLIGVLKNATHVSGD